MAKDRGGKNMTYDEAAVWIAGIGVAVTAYFSYRLLKATQATNKLSEATLELNKKLQEKEDKMREEFKVNMRRQLIPQILKQSEQAYNAVVGTEALTIHRQIQEAPKSLSIDLQELSNYFSREEVEIITKAWNRYDDYLSNYYKDGYQGNEIEKLLEKHEPVIMAFNELVNEFKYPNRPSQK
jgi:hypothetical protein